MNVTGRKRLVVMVSGGGTNLQAVMDACAGGEIDAEITRVFSNKSKAFALTRAANAGIATSVSRLADYRSEGATRASRRAKYDQDLAAAVLAERPDYVVLAGWMHVLSPTFLDAFGGRVINLHPALPGDLPGLHAIERAFEEAQRGERTSTGIMVHRVVPEIDAGPVLGTIEIAIEPTDTLDSLATRIHAAEHALLTEVLASLCQSNSPESQSQVQPTPGRSQLKKRAIISVTDKSGVEELGRGLAALDFELVASGGTAVRLIEAGLQVAAVEDITGHPEILGGRVKTLHPAVHGGILARRTSGHLAELDRLGYGPVDVVVCNLYAFDQAVSDPEITDLEAMEKVDIGGVTLLRAAAKNFEHVAVVSDPADYAGLLEALESGALDETRRRQLALKAFRHTAAYDASISQWLSGRADEQHFPSQIAMVAEKTADLRYGENPHQAAALYRWRGKESRFEQLQGKALSFNNLVDLDAAWKMPSEFEVPAVAIIKHTNPCGLATGKDVLSAFNAALACDPVSAFGSVITTNREIDLAFVEGLGKLFVEVLAAPAYTAEALEYLGRKKKTTRVMAVRLDASAPLFPTADTVIKQIDGGLLVMDADHRGGERESWRVVSQKQPTEAQRDELAFAWLAVKHVKSNAIVLTQSGATVGVGAGQMNRVGSVRIAAEQAGEKAVGSTLGSDAFFPFPDGIEAAAEAGVVALIQPGGSKNDALAIEAADKHGLVMIFTDERHFLH
ncbi:MAG: phosphoribosylaminoimidazolecarboxamide formyltransferase/IMP cyclohydrolase [Myxococcota bacterium]